MKKKILSILAIIFILMPCLMLTACIGAGDPPDDNPPQTPENEVNITYVLNGQIVETKKSSKSSINTPTTVTLPGGYGVEGWYLDNNTFINKLDSDDIDESDLTVYAKVIELFSIQNKILTSFYDTSATSFVVPNGVEFIGSDVFKDNTTIKTITLPNGLKEIGFNSFEGCTNLQSINLPNSLTNILNDAFFGCSNLQSINIPDGVEVGARTFRSCINLESIRLPSDLVEIMDGTFQNTNITGIELPETLEIIGEHAFYECISLIEIYIPDSVKTIGEHAFCRCGSLVRVFLGSGLEKVEDYAFARCDIFGISVKNAQTTYGIDVFDGNDSLTWVYIDSQGFINEYLIYTSEILKAEKIYIKTGLNVSNATKFLSKYTNYSNSDVAGYDKYTKNK